MNNINDIGKYCGAPIYIATQEWQRRKHHKKRINKKWRKRYGCIEFNLMPHGEIVLINGAFWMTKKTFIELKAQIQLEKKDADKNN